MKLYDRLPDAVTVDGKRVRLQLDFRNVLRMLETLQRVDLTPEAREWVAVRYVCRHPKKGTLDAVKSLLFEAPGKQGKRVTSFEQDAPLIRAAFRQVYGIDLWTAKMHWLQFVELLHGLPDGNRYTETIGIRAREMPEPTKYNQKEREWLARAKAQVALKISDDEAQDNYHAGVKSIFDVLMQNAKEVEH